MIIRRLPEAQGLSPSIVCVTPLPGKKFPIREKTGPTEIGASI